MLNFIRRSRRPAVHHFGMFACGTAVIIWAWTAFNGKQQSAADEKPTRTNLKSLPPLGTADGSDQSAVNDDASLRKRALGTWEDYYHGKRTLTLREDGTATMIMQPEGMGAVLFAKELVFDIEWKIQDGILILETVGGKPAKKISLVTKLYGDCAEEEILELTEDRFLVAHDEDTDFDWKRVPDAE